MMALIDLALISEKRDEYKCIPRSKRNGLIRHVAITSNLRLSWLETTTYRGSLQTM